jgi:fatty-acid peroxygenase
MSWAALRVSVGRAFVPPPALRHPTNPRGGARFHAAGEVWARGLLAEHRWPGAGSSIMKQTASALPARPGLDSTLAFLREGYRFVGRTCDALGGDAFRTRMMLQPVVCMRGPDAAAQFYREGRFIRKGAMPRSVVPLLQDWGSVQTLDGPDHRHRKRIFAQALEPQETAAAAAIFRRHWHDARDGWAGRTVSLQAEVERILTCTALEWTGVPYTPADVWRRCEELAAMVAQAGSFGPSYLRARLLRRRSEAWAQALVVAVRDGDLAVRTTSPLETVALHRSPAGDLLPPEIAAVELLNLLRPIVAVARFVVFAAHALHVHGGMPPTGEAETLAFVQEVRRFYPFFPVIAGRVREPFAWNGHAFDKDDWVILDLYGTNHHPDAWETPEAFRPARFLTRADDLQALVPQGGGAWSTGHRCPGELLTIALVGEAIGCMAETDWRVPPQDLDIPMNRFPTAPRDGFRVAVAA